MELFVHKNRNVVVKRADKGEWVDVSFVGVAENVAGAKRRGRYPNYEKMSVKASELVAFESPSDVWINRAQIALSESGSVESVETAEMAPESFSDDAS